jgi:hypothetical protein
MCCFMWYIDNYNEKRLKILSYEIISIKKKNNCYSK